MSSRRMSLLVRNLRYESSPERVRKYFEQFGEIRDVYLPLHYHTKKPRGFGFVEFFDDRDAHECLRQTHKTILDGNEISVTIAQQGRKSPDTMRVREVRQRDDGSESWSGPDGRGRSRSRSYSPYGGDEGGRGGGNIRRGRNSRRDNYNRRDDYPPRDRNRGYDRRQRAGSRSRTRSITPEEGRGRGGDSRKGIRRSGSAREYNDWPRKDRTRSRRESSRPVRSRGASSPISRSREDGAESGRAGNWQHSDSKRSEQYRNSSPNRAWKSRSRSRGLGSQPSDVDANPEAPYASRSVSRSRSRSRSVCSESGTAPQRVTSEAQNDAAVDGEVAGVILTDVRDNYSPRNRSYSRSPSRSRSRSCD